jgi:hypothetical protein
MGLSKSKLKLKLRTKSKFRDNIISTKNCNNFRDKYEKAYALLGEKIYNIPVKHIVEILNIKNWNDNDIIHVLSYIKVYTQNIGKDFDRAIEIQNYIDCLRVRLALDDIKNNAK